jgi:hypothetical protein
MSAGSREGWSRGRRIGHGLKTWEVCGQGHACRFRRNNYKAQQPACRSLWDKGAGPKGDHSRHSNVIMDVKLLQRTTVVPPQKRHPRNAKPVILRRFFENKYAPNSQFTSKLTYNDQKSV